ncbi:MAG TPA: tetratricopeptide repeat protein [Candidatus Baltobacteraceae bacterium]|nr:tetratricopeptide repeat protein [Candidatus Baltobacteraceae bacterium]
MKTYARLKDVERRLLSAPASVELRYERAKLLDTLGRVPDATTAYADVLARAPKHFGAITDLALMLYKAGRRQDALALYLEAVERHPQSAVAHANLGFMYLKANEPTLARTEYETAVRLDPRNAEAQRGLAAAIAQAGDAAQAATQADAPRRHADSLVSIPYRGRGTPVRLLVLVTLAAGNVALEPLLDDEVFATTKLIVELHGDEALPPHDVLFNAIGDADSAAAALELAERVVAKNTPAPASATQRPDAILNDPAHVKLTGRAANAARFGALRGVVAPRTELIAKAQLAGADASTVLARRGLAFPVLLRSPGYHTGRNFERVDRPEDLAQVAARLPGETLLAIEYVDTRAADGTFRKYRVMFVGGRLYPLHMAISRDWKVHYFSADMADNPGHRALDEAFLTDMRAALGAPAIEALERIRDTLGLDYAGVDFALNAAGEIVVFEANATMIVPTIGDDPRWAYRRAPVARITGAVRAMLAAKGVPMPSAAPAGHTRR